MKKPLLPVAALLLLAACDDIMAPDISAVEVDVVAPVNKVEVAEGRVTFRWNALRGAERYRVTIVSPDFAHAGKVVRDTVMYQDSLATNLGFGFALDLAPSKYQWSIQAFNHAYASLQTVRSLTVVPKAAPEPENPEEPTQPEEPAQPEP